MELKGKIEKKEKMYKDFYKKEMEREFWKYVVYAQSFVVLVNRVNGSIFKKIIHIKRGSQNNTRPPVASMHHIG